MAEKSEEVVSSNSFSTQMLWSISLFRVYKSDVFYLGGGGGRKQMDHTVQLYLLQSAFSTRNLKVSISLFNWEMSDRLHR